MEMSIEMMIQSLNRMIDIRNLLIDMQDDIGVYNSVGKETSVLVYQTERFFKMAEFLNAEVQSGDNEIHGDMRLFFYHKEIAICTYILSHERELYRDRIQAGEDNA